MSNINTRATLLPYPIDKAYDYAVSNDETVEEGAYVCVPLGARQVPAVIWGEGLGETKPEKLKSVILRYDVPSMPKVHRDFLDWVSSYTLSPKGSVLKLSLSVPKALEPLPTITGYVIGDVPEGSSFSPAGQRIVEVAKDGLPRRLSELASEAECSTGAVKTLYNKGVLKSVELSVPAPCRAPDYGRAGAMLSAPQAECADTLKNMVSDNKYSAALLDGVTGAGKTEVYFEAVAQALKQNKQVLILLPEIALSNAFLDRFKKRFGCSPALWHSGLSSAKRKVTWRGVASGESKVVIGARSALFLPYNDLGLIIVDEEHDPAYKQEEGVIYHARDMAVVRAHLGGFPIVMVSATPSLETIYNAWHGRYHHLTLPERHGGATLPDIHLIDLREDKPENKQNFISPTLQQAVGETIGRGEQALLFLNRRGYAPLTLCRHCGYRFQCPRCTAWMIEHRQGMNRAGKLHCHHCDHYLRVPDQCPECGEQDSLAACGPGVERIAEEVKEKFPEARSIILSSDTADTHEKLETILDQIHKGEVDIIIGTQIIAKGHHFSDLTCVGVIDADLGLSGGDLRATERTYQLLHQVAGRAGREKRQGNVYLQSFSPETRVMQALANGDRDGLLEVELDEREITEMPPFSRLVGIIISGRDEREVEQAAQMLGRCAPQGEKIQTLGPAEAVMYRLRGKYRRRLLVRADKSIDVQKTVRHWINSIKVSSKIRIQIDIDPQSFF